ncbi:hypothetical protein CKAH01_05905 [Colletotrichum kahawae]|uniref:Uncharacterized protein n=1 Tax=Colletotrichum kahawae TaxID=34407 RepID=A0AAD9Y9J9_COLKA|nr:hypothetical protein CKAH01_05905 [Colletotrichum kahawae]
MEVDVATHWLDSSSNLRWQRYLSRQRLVRASSALQRSVSDKGKPGGSKQSFLMAAAGPHGRLRSGRVLPDRTAGIWTQSYHDSCGETDLS